VVTGGIAAGVNIVSRWLLEYLISYEVSIGIAYLIGMTTAFFLARIFVFEPVADAAHWQFVRFAMVNAAAFAQVWLVSVGLARIVFPAIGFTSEPELVAHVIGVMSPIVSSYVLHKRFSFRPHRTRSSSGETKDAERQTDPREAAGQTGTGR
jgi:putative flippase GtrA